jgi:hypothetical protein
MCEAGLADAAAVLRAAIAVGRCYRSAHSPRGSASAAGNLTVPRGTAFSAAVRAREGLYRLLLENAIVPNFGGEPFAHGPPPGTHGDRARRQAR